MAPPIAPGSRIIAREEEWLVRRVDRTQSGAQLVTVTGLSPLVRDREARFFDSVEAELDEPIAVVDPKAATPVRDESPYYRDTRLFLEALLRQSTPPDAMKETISRGVTNGVFAYVSKRGDGTCDPFCFEEALISLDIEISEDTNLITRETAETYREQQTAEKEGSTGQPGEPSGETPDPAKSTTPPSGPDTDEGEKTTPGTSDKSVQTDLFSKLSWSGDVPPQKWMHFYTKVLSKYSADRKLKLKVAFEIAPENGVSKERFEETKAALREMGLDPDLDSK